MYLLPIAPPYTTTGGIFSSPNCTDPDAGDAANIPRHHSVVVVGAGVDEETGTPYWLIRTSFGPNWGEGGYMRMIRGAGM